MFFFHLRILEEIKDLLLSKAGVEGKSFFIWDLFLYLLLGYH